MRILALANMVMFIGIVGGMGWHLNHNMERKTPMVKRLSAWLVAAYSMFQVAASALFLMGVYITEFQGSFFLELLCTYRPSGVHTALGTLGLVLTVWILVKSHHNHQQPEH